ncbi:MAG: type II secretion system protein [Firmicutes bacterium]|nr:type II secretion system protein [Bacillota bacterium]
MNNSKGFTLTEIIVVLVILAVLAAFTIPTMLGYVSSSQEKLCNITRMDMTRLYKTSLIGKEASASTDGFKSFAIENWGSLSQCPAGGDYTYSASLGADGKVTAEILCSKHGSAHVLTTDEAAIPSKDGMKGVLGFGPPV